MIIHDKIEDNFLQYDNKDDQSSKSGSHITISSYESGIFDDEDLIEPEIFEKKMLEMPEKDIGKFIFRPNDDLKLRWDLVVMVGAIINCFAIPL